MANRNRKRNCTLREEKADIKSNLYRHFFNVAQLQINDKLRF